jgi:hypothetical protein
MLDRQAKRYQQVVQAAELRVRRDCGGTVEQFPWCLLLRQAPGQPGPVIGKSLS